MKYYLESLSDTFTHGQDDQKSTKTQQNTKHATAPKPILISFPEKDANVPRQSPSNAVCQQCNDVLLHPSKHVFLAIMTHNPLHGKYMSKRVKVQGSVLNG